MAQEIKAAIVNSRHTLASDAIGAVALGVILFAGLCLPGLL